MKVAIVGSRTASNDLREQCWKFGQTLPLNTVIVSGGASGIDTVANNIAFSRGLQTEIYPADWKRFSKSAGMIRNRDIVKAADVIVAFWDGKSKGTANTIEQARKAGKRVLINPTQWEPTK